MQKGSIRAVVACETLATSKDYQVYLLSSPNAERVETELNVLEIVYKEFT